MLNCNAVSVGVQEKIDQCRGVEDGCHKGADQNDNSNYSKKSCHSAITRVYVEACAIYIYIYNYEALYISQIRYYIFSDQSMPAANAWIPQLNFGMTVH